MSKGYMISWLLLYDMFVFWKIADVAAGQENDSEQACTKHYQ